MFDFTIIHRDIRFPACKHHEGEMPSAATKENRKNIAITNKSLLPYNESLLIFRRIKAILKPTKGELVMAVGGIRRKTIHQKDIDILVNIRLDDIAGRLALPSVESDRRKLSITSAGIAAISHKAPSSIAIDIFYASNSEWPFALLHYTGNSIFNIQMRKHAKSKGYKLNQYGIFNANTGRRVRGVNNIKTEKDIFKLLELPYKTPINRDTT